MSEHRKTINRLIIHLSDIIDQAQRAIDEAEEYLLSDENDDSLSTSPSREDV